MPTAAIYTRLSHNPDGTRTGTDRQEADCRALCKREGLKVAAVYTDDDRSAYNGAKRPGFEQLLAELGGYDAVVYWKTDRLVRRTTQFWRVVAACEAADTRLVSVVDPIDTSTPLGKGVAGMLAAMGEQESHNTGVRVSRANAERAGKGQSRPHRRAFGYTADGTAVVKSEARTIREARDRILRGDSMRSICDDWNRRGVMPTSALAWRVTTFRRMMTSARIAGLCTYRGEVVGAGAWPAIITPEEHARIVAALGDPSVRTRGRPATYLLTGMVRCGRCGATLRSSVHAAGRRWTCRRVPGDDSHCGRLVIQAEPTNDWVEQAILYRLDSAALKRALRRRNRPGTKTTVAEVDDLEHRLTQLGTDHDDGIISRREWLDRRTKLVARLDAARAELARANGADPLASFVDVDVAKRWKALSLDAKRKVAAALIDHVTILPPDVPGARGFDADRVGVTWQV